MKFIVSSGHLLKKLQMIGGVLGSNNTMRILDNFLFELEEDKLKVSSTDLETGMTSWMTVEGDGEGAVALQGKMLIDILKQFPDQPLTFLFKENNIVEISSEQGDYSIAYISGSEFPKSITIPNSKAAKIKGRILSRAIGNTLFASGNDDLRPMMNGILFSFSEDKITFVATDAHKLAVYERTDVIPNVSGEFIMPKKALAVLKNIYAEIDSDVSVEFNESNARFFYDDTELICRLVDGKFPNYSAVMPKENPNVLTINREELLNSIRRMTLFSNKVNHQVQLKLAGANMKISAQDVDYNNQAEERLTCQYLGDDLEIGFNSKFFSEMLSLLRSEEVKLEMSFHNKAAILTPIDGNEEGESILMLVMPVTVP